MRKTFGMNRHQKLAHKPGERQVSREQVEELLVLSQSEDPNERQVAAQYLCPCHVRTRIPAVWDALYRMLEDPDARVRRAAWHTLEDGGRPDDPALDEIFDRALGRESDPAVLRLMRQVIGPRKEREIVALRVAHRSAPKERGKCDFCGRADVFVERDYSTMIPIGADSRAAWACETCAN